MLVMLVGIPRFNAWSPQFAIVKCVMEALRRVSIELAIA